MALSYYSARVEATVKEKKTAVSCLNSHHRLLVVMWSKIPDETRWGCEDGSCSSRHNGDVQRIPLTTSRVWWDAKKKKQHCIHFICSLQKLDSTMEPWPCHDSGLLLKLQCEKMLTHNRNCSVLITWPTSLAPFPPGQHFFSSNIYLLSYCCLICVFRRAAYLDWVSKIATFAENTKAKHRICPVATVFVCICDVHIK